MERRGEKETKELLWYGAEREEENEKSKVHKFRTKKSGREKRTWKLINMGEGKKEEKQSYTRSYAHYPQKSG